MQARSTTFRGVAEPLDAGLATLRDEVLPAVQAVPGCVGLSMLVEREAGTCIVTSAWESEQALRAGAAQVAPLRVRAQEVLGSRPEVRTWQIGVLHRAHTTPAGAWVRVTWTRVPRELLDEHRDVFCSDVLPRVERLPGFCSASLLLDRHTGRSALAVAYDSHGALTEAREAAGRLRAEAMRRGSSELLAVAELEVVLAHLRVPETV